MTMPERQTFLHNWSTPLLRVVDRSRQPRWGCKGPAAASWLQGQGIPIPPGSNSWIRDGAWAVYRLGRSEFLLEAEEFCIQSLRQSIRQDSVYPVWHDGAALLLEGRGVPSLLRQICSVDFTALALDTRPVVLTSMMGVSVIAVPEADLQKISLWFDGSYSHYFQEMLEKIVPDLSLSDFHVLRGL
ncbi:hypothetical protein [Acidithiobacillus sp. AMEEHan]|uniref:hypothetical protein n=1 Tax=Acidithiobacillus sp. AMEEHan TaxID=2994951 RepID=UPI0027E47679|nr:hypothetical protein [Acidithiobacillus sp. AMEEHan]